MIFKALCGLAVMGMLFTGVEKVKEAENQYKPTITSQQTMEVVKQTKEKYKKENVSLEYRECLEQAEQCLENGEYSKERLTDVLKACFGFEEDAIQYAIEEIYN